MYQRLVDEWEKWPYAMIVDPWW